MTKTCRVCKEEKPLERFYRKSSNKDGRSTICKPCDSKKGKEWARKNPEKRRKIVRRYYENNPLRYQKHAYRKYGVPDSLMDSVYKETSGPCWICGVLPEEDRAHCVDHDHETGEFRGVLCRSCNKGLGHFKDNKDLVERASKYLKNPPGLKAVKESTHG